jgi:hypothetical protein
VTLLDLLWLPPVMLAVALVLGASGRTGYRAISRAVVRTFLGLTLGVVAVGIAIHLISNFFA